MSVEEIDRIAIANEVFGENEESTVIPVEPNQDDAESEDAELAGEDTTDPWANVNPVVKAEFEALRSKVSASDAMEMRLKKAESRLGSVLNELHAAKEAAKTVSDAPSKEQILEATENQKAWDGLKDDFPEWAQGIESRIAATSAEIRKEFPNVAAIREEINKEFNQRYIDLESRLTGGIVASRHPNWQEDVNSAEFQTWRQENNVDDTLDPAVAIAHLNAYHEYKNSKPSVRDIKAEREQRLKTAENVTGRKLNAPKSEADMSVEELRAHIAAGVWEEK
jgi:hypothetical protein